MRRRYTVLLVLLLVAGMGCVQTLRLTPRKRFVRVFSWGQVKDEETARKLHAIGVTDVRVSNEKELALARTHGMTPYCGTFTPRGPHGQVMSPEEEKHFAYINGLDLRDKKDMTRAERKAEIDRRRIEMMHRYGGEPVAALDTINSTRIPCFSSDSDYTLSKKAIDTICARVEGAQGIYFDYIGYSNFKGCYCETCLAAYRKYLADKGLPDTEETRNGFYLERLVTYCNDMIDYVKERHPDFKVVLHVYPTFLPQPVYGNRLKADYCGQTVAWYFPWERERIVDHTRTVVRDQNRFYPGVQGIPFVGLNTRPGSLWVKDSSTLECELQAILAAGGSTLMVCNGNDMLDPGIAEVFQRYCGNNGGRGGGD